MAFPPPEPVLASAAVAKFPRKVTVGEREIVVWRSKDGTVHAMDNRCPHNGVRLSVGSIAGDLLVCAAHGWSFAGDGRCAWTPPGHPFDPDCDVIAHQAWEDGEHVWVQIDDSHDNDPRPVRTMPP